MKQFAKKIIDLCAIILLLPLIALYKLISLFSSDDASFASYSQLLSLIPGKTGSFLRKNFYRSTMTKCSEHCFIGFGTLFSQHDTEIEEGVYIGPQCNIGKSRIEKNCLLGSGIHILSGKNQHDFKDLNTPIREQGGKFTKISIGEDSWIGNNSVIMANIGKKCVIAAGSVVINDIPDYSIVGGNPARILKSRLSEPDNLQETQTIK